MFGAAPDIAGGVVSATLANGDNAQDVFGCKAVRQSAGNVIITTDQRIPMGRGRLWIQLEATFLATESIAQLSETEWLVITSLIGLGAGPVLTLTDTNYKFTFGVSMLPNR